MEREMLKNWRKREMGYRDVKKLRKRERWGRKRDVKEWEK